MIEGPELTLTDAESLCACARFCDPNGQVWSQVEQTQDPKVRANFIRQVNDCPAGRLVAWNRATGEPLEQPLPLSIGLVEDPAQHASGPLWLRGGIPVVAADGFTYEVRNRVTLCRCGPLTTSLSAMAPTSAWSSATRNRRPLRPRGSRLRTGAAGPSVA